jgi:peptidoglycan hydrolase-like protein with peptidoglycan-binding domain
MSPSQRVKTYGWLIAAMSATVCANLLLMQPSPNETGRLAATGNKAMRAVADTRAGTAADQVADTVRAIQRELKALRIYPGQVDGKPSPLVHAAIVAYEQAQTLPITGEPTQALLRDLIVGPSASGAPPVSQGLGVSTGSAAERLVRDIRQKLASLGYAPGNGDGRLTIELTQAIRAFEKDNGLPQTGRISANLLLHIQRSAAAFKPAKQS